ncbi:rab GTPase-binding effector protein 2 isoform X3 [Alligator mississippiensis]|uniref:rab GTPase-binding effector protein 2 isoform X3 n=1 Tax=Alligator mississippiensis TaxID=8496 RepID=UPI0009075CB0|nr:rab GTPase-binding effector protein 2 isoform X3 [Alligator mississippiensis]
MEGPCQAEEPPGALPGPPLELELEAAGGGDPQATIRALQAELATVRAVAAVSEATKQEAVAAVQRRCQDEVASLQAILTESISSYELRLAALRQEQRGGGIQPSAPPLDSLEQQMEKAQEDASRLRGIVLPMEEEIAQLKAKLGRAEALIRDLRGGQSSLGGSSESLLSEPGRLGPEEEEEEEGEGGVLAFARGGDSLSIGGSPRPRRPSPDPSQGPGPGEQDDTASLVSTATLVPESIYLPPPGFQLVPAAEWGQLQLEVRRQQEQLEAAMQEKLGLEEALRRSSEDCSKQVQVLLHQVQRSEQLLQNLQVTVSQTQHRTQEQLAELALAHKRLSHEVQRLSEENEGLRDTRPHLAPGDGHPELSSSQELLRRAEEHQAERLRIEIVGLREQLEQEVAARGQLQAQLDSRCDDSQLMEASLCSVRSEMERLQQALAQAQERVQGLETEAEQLRGELVQRQQQGQTWEQEKTVLVAALDTSEQVRLEQIRQAPSLAEARRVADGAHLDVAAVAPPARDQP